MSKVFLQEGKIVELTAPGGGVVSGQMLKISDLLVIAMGSAAATEKFSASLGGVHSIKKKSADVVAEGDTLYWDDSAKELTSTTTGNFLAGAALKAAGNGVVSVDFRLDGIAVPNASS